MFTFSKDEGTKDWARSETTDHYTMTQLKKAKGTYQQNDFGGVLIPPDASCSSNAILDRIRCAVSSFGRSSEYAVEPGNRKKLITSILILLGGIIMFSIVYHMMPQKLQKQILPFHKR